jgi:catechol 2,3-dioxygenase-like lactoylglutathione lyase family enzyme
VISIEAFDHIVLAVADVERSVAFYRDVLGLPVERYEAWRAGQVPFPSVRVTPATLIDIIPGLSADDRAGRVPNLNHFCMVVAGASLEPVVEHLTAHGVRVTTGPAKRWGARGDGVSVYFRDPDDNEIELRTYAPIALEQLKAARAGSR